jgi:signal transduction histidine kinase
LSWIDARKVPVLLALATLIPIGALSWLGSRTLQQDRELERQRSRERLEVAAGRVALDIERHLQNIEDRLSAGNGIRLTPGGVESSQELPILYQPVDFGLTPAPSSPLLVAAEVEEFQRRNDQAALDAYRKASQNGEPGARAAAFLGLARVLRRRGNYDGALEAYDHLAALGSVRVAGQPAGVVGWQGRCKVFEERRDTRSLTAAAAELAAALYSARWPIDRSTFMLYREMLERWGAPPPPADSLARTEAAAELWNLWRSGDLPSRGRRLLQREHAPVLAVWAGNGDTATGSFLSTRDLQHALQPLASAQGLALSVAGTDGTVVFGDTRAGISLTPDETRLPFIMRAAPLSSNVDPQESVRRAVIISALSLAFALMAAAAFGLYRATTRQLLLARQQSDFVSAVSHEFRTPLTSMRHLTELLVSRSITSEERRTQYYDLLAHETERLHRMVESLLSFGRIDAGAYAWRLEPADIDDMVHGIVQEFSREPVAAGHQLVCEVEEGLPPIRADRESLSRAFWNLLENAGKYSDAGTPIRVFARRQGDSVLVGVGDQGAGIPIGEREKIFEKFVRGADAKRAGVRGVGIGLALVKRIAEAHGGSIQVDSEPGHGSTFTLVLPCHES